MDTLKVLSHKIKAEACRLGFSACGIASANISANREHLSQWLDKGYQADMRYLENNFDKRCNPQLLVEDARSIICVALNYYPQKKLQNGQLQFAYYAYGKDYHDVMKEKLKALFSYINMELLPVKGRVFCDTAPVLERYWAQQSGIGWIGKNTLLIIPHAGSYFFLGELVIDAELAYDSPIPNRCGNCTRCLDACPTKALESPYLLNANKCLSYLTIENKDKIKEEYAFKMGNYIYGCDRCQRSCPWNRFATPNTINELQPSEAFLRMMPEDWKKLTIEEYRILFKSSAVKRAKYEGLMRNIKAIDNENEQ